jgi:hypothetical protein
VVMLLTCIWKVADSNAGWDTDIILAEDGSWFSLGLPYNIGIVL